MCSPVSCCFKKKETFVVNSLTDGNKNGTVKQNGEIKETDVGFISIREEVRRF